MVKVKKGAIAMTKETSIKLFESKKIRSVWNEKDQKWYFSVADVIEALTDSVNVKDYIKKMRKRDSELNSNWGTLCPPLELVAPDGKRRKTQGTLRGTLVGYVTY
jgi:hypothetical protein